jgi:hypothetical protein
MSSSLTATISPLTVLLPIATQPRSGAVVYAREAQPQGRPPSAPRNAASPARARKSFSLSTREGQVTRMKPATDPNPPGRIETLGRREAATRAGEVNTPSLSEGGRATSACDIERPVVHVERGRVRRGVLGSGLALSEDTHPDMRLV